MRRLLIVAIVVVLGGGCVTPSIPIPPPSPAKMSFEVTVEGGQSQAVFTYEPDDNYVGAVVYLFNRNRGNGIIQAANPDGSVGPTQPMAAAVGEEIVVTFEREDQTVSRCIRLREGQQSSTDLCSP